MSAVWTSHSVLYVYIYIYIRMVVQPSCQEWCTRHDCIEIKTTWSHFVLVRLHSWRGVSCHGTHILICKLRCWLGMYIWHRWRRQPWAACPLPKGIVLFSRIHTMNNLCNIHSASKLMSISMSMKCDTILARQACRWNGKTYILSVSRWLYYDVEKTCDENVHWIGSVYTYCEDAPRTGAASSQASHNESRYLREIPYAYLVEWT